MNPRLMLLRPTFLLLLAAPVSFAQQAPQPPKPPFSVGGIGLTPSFSTGLTYTNNVRQNPAAVSDWRNDTLLNLVANVLSGPQANLTVNTTVTQRTYHEFRTDDQTMKSVLVNGDVQLGSGLSLSGAAQRFDSRILQSDPNAIPGSVSSLSHTTLGNLQLNYDSAGLYGKLVANTQSLSFGSSFLPASGTTVSNSDQNRRQTDTDVHLGYKFAAQKVNTYLYFGRNEVSYDSSFAPSVQGRNSFGTKLALGLGNDPTADINGTILLGTLRQTYDAVNLGTQTGLFGSATINLKLSPTDMAVLTYSRTFKETIIPGSTGYFLDQFTIQAQHVFSPSLSVDIAPTLYRASVAKIPAVLHQRLGRAGVNVGVSKGLTVRGEIMASRQDINNDDFASFRYNERAFTVTLSGNF